MDLQVLLGLTFVGTGLWKLATPVAELASKMPWMGQVSPVFLYVTATFDALGCAALMAGAIVFHFSRGEGANTPFNFVLAGLSLFIAWGRWKKAPIAARG